MNRREALVLVGMGSIVTLAQAAAMKPVIKEHALELRIATKKGDIPFSVEEFTADGKSAGIVRCDDEKGLQLFLSRTAKDASAPKLFRFIVDNGTTLEKVLAAVKASRASGFTEVRYTGCIPPGCSLVSGQGLNPTRYEGTPIKLDRLEKILSENSQKC